VIEIERVTYSYTSKRRAKGVASEPVLHEVDLTIYDGEFVCLLGPSGCGKTTVLRLVAGFVQPNEGVVRVGGTPVVGPGRDRGVIFQGDQALFPWLTVVDNAVFGLRLTGMARQERIRRAEHVLELVGLARADFHKMPHELSGGMRQRLQLARVLANEPETLLLDEPFGALDAQTRATLQNELSRVWQQDRRTSLFITHDISEAVLLADRIAVMCSTPRAMVMDVIDVPLARPRDPTSEEFVRKFKQVSDLLHYAKGGQRRPARDSGVPS
jgi:NitT/TauT family transport system ATP-binding protein